MANSILVAAVNLGLAQSGAFGVAITPNGVFDYVTNQGSGTVPVIDTASNTATHEGRQPGDVAITSNGANSNPRF